MVLFNYATKEITAKVVYYGPGLCGKTTNLQYVHSQLDPGSRGKLLSLATESDRTLFFDFLPLDLGKIAGFHVRFQLYTVPGQVHYNATRRMVLKGVDAVVFVADSQVEMMEHNVESFENLAENLKENGFDIEKVPLVLQLNKRDLPNILPVEEIVEGLKAEHLQRFESVASTGEGVFETLKAIIKLSVAKLQTEFRQEGVTEPAIDDFGPPPPPAPSYQPKPLFSADTPNISSPPASAQESPPPAPSAAAEEASAEEEEAETVALEEEITFEESVGAAEEESQLPRGEEEEAEEFDLTDFDESPETEEAPADAAEPPGAERVSPQVAILEEKIEELTADVRRLEEENRSLKKVMKNFAEGIKGQIDLLRRMSDAAGKAGTGEDEAGSSPETEG
jgi:signal recognition particle receptor subunit beta